MTLFAQQPTQLFRAGASDNERNPNLDLGESLRVLIVEDDPGQAATIADILTESDVYSFQAVNARSLGEAAELLQTEEFDVVLLDLTLPDSMGLDTVSAVHTAHPHVALVVLTAYNDHTLASKTARKGAQGYLYKGDTYGNRLECAIRDAIGRKRAEEEVLRLQPMLSSVRSSNDLHRTLGEILTTMCSLESWVYGEVWLPTTDGKHIERSSLWCSKDEELDEFAKLSEGFRLPVGEGLEGVAWESGRMVWVYDVMHELDFRRRPLVGEAKMKTAMFVPVPPESEPVAVIALFTQERSEEEE